MKIKIIKSSKQGSPSEYFCKNCLQLRLSLTDEKSKCGNCGSTRIIKGEVGTLNKANLIRLTMME
jgi:DNA-directed RNA polymerase subunit RPC12/RpoP